MRALFAFASFFSLCLPQAAPPKTPTTPAPATTAAAAPVTAGKSFHSDAMHLTYSYPATMQSAESMTSMMLQQQKAQATGEMKKTLDCVTIPFAGVDTAGGAPQLVMMFRADSSCLHLDLTETSLAQFTKGMSGGAEQTISGAKFTEPQPYKLGDRAASVMFGVITIPSSGSVHMAVACTMNKPDILCWQMIAPSTDVLAAIAASPVTFEGSTAMPVIPAGMLKAQ